MNIDASQIYNVIRDAKAARFAPFGIQLKK
jgi:hypothetical protein